MRLESIDGAPVKGQVGPSRGGGSRRAGKRSPPVSGGCCSSGGRDDLGDRDRTPRAQEAGELRSDASIGDVIRMVSGVAGVAFDDDEQRDRVVAMAIDGLRAR